MKEAASRPNYFVRFTLVFVVFAAFKAGKAGRLPSLCGEGILGGLATTGTTCYFSTFTFVIRAMQSVLILAAFCFNYGIPASFLFGWSLHGSGALLCIPQLNNNHLLQGCGLLVLSSFLIAVSAIAAWKPCLLYTSSNLASSFVLLSGGVNAAPSSLSNFSCRPNALICVLRKLIPL